jgi:hypothetical protein
LTRILVGALLLGFGAAVVAQAPQGDWRDAHEFLPLFAPSGARAAAYRIYVSPRDLHTVLTQIGSEPSAIHSPGAWLPAAQLPLDAFGQTGGYDRSKLARLYGAKRALVARGPRESAGPSTALGTSRPVEAWTLISPYPSRDLQRLEPGTMLIVLDLAFP